MSTDSSYLRVASMEAETAARLLQSYFKEDKPEIAARHLDVLSNDHVAPLLARVISRRLRDHSKVHQLQAEDLASDAVVAFLLHVEAMRNGSVREPIANFDAFVTMLGNRACSGYFRRAYPGFHRTSNKLRYLLDKSPRLFRQEGPGRDWICGLAEWEDLKPCGRIEDAASFEDLAGVKEPERMLIMLFQRVGAPLRFYDLVSMVAHLWNVQDGAVVLEDATQMAHAQSPPPPDVVLGRRKWLADVWTEIRELNQNQRQALLLNLRDEDGSCAANLFVMTGVASVVQIATATGIPPLEFASLWRKLPMSDMEIAERMQLSRQQVINLRKSARERLTRRMSKNSRGGW